MKRAGVLMVVAALCACRAGAENDVENASVPSSSPTEETRPADGAAATSQNASVEGIMRSALTYVADSKGNAVQGAEAASQLAASGAFTANSPMEYDYQHYFLPQRDLSLFGAKVVYFDVEYMQQYAGCCVDDGAAIVLKLEPDAEWSPIHDFAKDNRCTLNFYPDFNASDEIVQKTELRLVRMDENDAVAGPRILEMSCKAGDRQAYEDGSYSPDAAN